MLESANVWKFKRYISHSENEVTPQQNTNEEEHESIDKPIYPMAPEAVQVVDMCILRKLWSAEVNNHRDPIEEEDNPPDHGNGDSQLEKTLSNIMLRSQKKKLS